MKQRIITASWLIAIIVGALLLGKTALAVLLAVFSLGGVYEHSRLLTEDKNPVKNSALILADLAVLAAAYFAPRYLFDVYIAAVLILFSVEMMVKEPYADRCAIMVWGLTYTGLFMALGIRLVLHEQGYYVIIPAALSCASCDNAAYLVGSAFGKHKLTPISPHKTVEGAVGGFFGGYIVFAASYFFAGQADIPDKMLFYFAGGIIFGIIGQFGDLAASIVKRKYGVKDYGTVFPGHGGFLDRFDSYLFAFAAAYVYADIFMGL
ncbi:MAG: phosphatidate cytidylyltransferase [Eubacteriaceae bacterium]|nr:phosphatidate cytidylyltransferase [Eubacteriaceae bacterium]